MFFGLVLGMAGCSLPLFQAGISGNATIVGTWQIDGEQRYWTFTTSTLTETDVSNVGIATTSTISYIRISDTALQDANGMMLVFTTHTSDRFVAYYNQQYYAGIRGSIPTSVIFK